jgi:hypothetical protein
MPHPNPGCDPCCTPYPRNQRAQPTPYLYPCTPCPASYLRVLVVFILCDWIGRAVGVVPRLWRTIGVRSRASAYRWYARRSRSRSRADARPRRRCVIDAPNAACSISRPPKGVGVIRVESRYAVRLARPARTVWLAVRGFNPASPTAALGRCLAGTGFSMVEASRTVSFSGQVCGRRCVLEASRTVSFRRVCGWPSETRIRQLGDHGANVRRTR